MAGSIMTQQERINHMEQILDEAREVLTNLEEAYEKYLQVQGAIAELDEYYGSSIWRQDYEDDERGRLPQDLKRGVLSEDAVYNLLTDNERVQRMIKLCYNSDTGR